MISIQTSTRRIRFSKGLILFWINLALLNFILPAMIHRFTSPEASQGVAAKTNEQGGNPEGSQPADAPSAGPAKFKVRYQTRKRIRHPTAARRIAGNERVMMRLVREVNGRLSLPFDIDISMEECGAPDAFYDTDTHQITVCYEAIDAYYLLFLGKVQQEERLNEVVAGAMSLLLVHEMGHALVDVWELPVTGREEDAVDQLSTLMLINSVVGGERLALNGARSFKLFAELEEHERKLFWDEHSQDAQRYYDTICLIYGHDPQHYAYMVNNGTLPEDRAELCSVDYQKVKNAWNTLLSPYANGALWPRQEPDPSFVSFRRVAPRN